MTDKHVLKNGMVILGERIEQIASAAFTFLLPCGAGLFSEGQCGTPSVIADWIFRGAGGKDNRQLSDALDGLGLHRHSNVSSSHISLGAGLESGNLTEALKLYNDIILQPALDDDQFELSRQLAMQEVIGLDDDPRHKVMLELRERFYPSPLGSSPVGKLDDLKKLTADTARNAVHNNFDLSNAIFAVAGNYNFDSVCKTLESLMDISQDAKPLTPTTNDPVIGYTHLDNEGAQVHIGLMTETVSIHDPGYYDARIAISILSGGMSSRLFTEVREKRGLCYAVGAQYHSLKEMAGYACYAGTVPDKAQETYDVILCEFERLRQNITESEMQRAQIGLKSSLIVQSESSSARANGIAKDYYLLGRVRDLDEIKKQIDQTSSTSVTEFLNQHRFNNYTVVTIGPKKINV